MRLKVEAFFKVDVWDNRFILNENKVDWTKATLTDQGLDRMGDSYWWTGLHIGDGANSFTEASTGLNSVINYTKSNSGDVSIVNKDSENIFWEREVRYKFAKMDLNGSAVSEVSMSWDVDNKTAVALLALGQKVDINQDQDLIITCKVRVSESLTETRSGEVDFGASKHQYVIKPCFYTKYENSYIGSQLVQKEGRVYSGSIPLDASLEPDGSIDSNLANFETYTFETRSRKFQNFFTLSSPNAVTRTATSHTFGIPSAYAIEFNPPIDKDFNRELTLNFMINWDRG